MPEEHIADLLLAEIAGFAERVQRENPLLQAALQGRVTPATVASYLAGLKCLFQHTLIDLETGARVAGQHNLPELVEYFKHKHGEEDGHWRWAESDLVELERVFGVAAPDVPNSMLRWVAFTGEVVRTHPHHYLAYVLFAEYLTVLAGAAWVNALGEHCGIPLSALSSITRHVELDQFHVAEGRDQINHLLRHVREPGPFLETARRAMSHFEAFCDELTLSLEPPRLTRSDAAQSPPP
jgi:hypothetical protein